MPHMIRQTVYFSGHVQGVGFRYMAVRIAQRYPSAGYVQNLDDGRVCLVCEGEQEQMNALVQAVAENASNFIREHSVEQSEATGEFGQPRPGALRIRF